MAAVIGAALAAVIPTAPLAGLSKHLTVASALLGATGLLFVSVTMVLVLRVMQPQSVSYDEIQNAEAPGHLRLRLRKIVGKHSADREAPMGSLYKLRKDIEDHPDMYLPCGVGSLCVLRQLMVVEEVTLMALVGTVEQAGDDAASRQLRKARAARAARLHELRTAAAGVVVLGAYYQVRARSTNATYWGVVFGFLGLITIVAAVAWPVT